MQEIITSKVKIGKHNGRAVGMAVAFGADVIRDIGAQDREFVTFSVVTSPGRVVLTVEEEKEGKTAAKSTKVKGADYVIQ